MVTLAECSKVIFIGLHLGNRAEPYIPPSPVNLLAVNHIKDFHIV